MNFNRALSEYSNVGTTSYALNASNVELVMMLFDGLNDSLTVTMGHIQHGSLTLKNKSIHRASSILCGLLEGLDIENGGDLALNLQSLYVYMLKRLVHINAYNDVQALQEIKSLVTDIASAWREVPYLVQFQKNTNHDVLLN